MAHTGGLPEWAPPQYLKYLRPLMPGETEYQMMDYGLKLALRSATVKVLSVHALHTTDDNIKFERERLGSVVVDSWVYTPALPEDNTISMIASHGGRFRIGDPSKGALFSSGAVRLHADESGDEYSQRNRPPGAMQLEFLHLRLATGQSFVMERDQIGKYPVPEGYHSIKVHRDNDGGDFYHEYIINDEARIWPDFVVNCIYDPEEDRRGLAGLHNKVASWRIHCYQDLFGHTADDLETQKRRIEDRKRTIVTQLHAIDQKMTQVTENHAHAQDKIYNVVQQVVQMLHNRTQAKLNLLQSDDVELRRQMQYFDWLDSFVNYQKSLLERGVLDPVEFLQNTSQHKLVVNEAPCEIVDSYSQVTADLKVVGNLTILVDDARQPTLMQ
ncbi:hypothetical protein DIPPA_22721 [Diplonema papillatum]|nr:hypothetical protein DIPPA_22721 [Diplonema papillatum]|eukprot:gene19897-30601_t